MPHSLPLPSGQLKSKYMGASSLGLMSSSQFAVKVEEKALPQMDGASASSSEQEEEEEDGSGGMVVDEDDDEDADDDEGGEGEQVGSHDVSRVQESGSESDSGSAAASCASGDKMELEDSNNSFARQADNDMSEDDDDDDQAAAQPTVPGAGKGAMTKPGAGKGAINKPASPRKAAAGSTPVHTTPDNTKYALEFKQVWCQLTQKTVAEYDKEFVAIKGPEGEVKFSIHEMYWSAQSFGGSRQLKKWKLAANDMVMRKTGRPCVPVPGRGYGYVPKAWERWHLNQLEERYGDSNIKIPPEYKKPAFVATRKAMLLASGLPLSGRRKQGGDLGEVRPGQMVGGIDRAIFKGPLNTLQGPLKSKFGYHLLEVFFRG